MSATLRKSLLALPLTLLFSAACWGQTMAFEGTVLGDDGKPLQGAVIKIERTDIKGNWNTKTDKKGHYFYGGLQGGAYKVYVGVGGAQGGMIGMPRAHHGDPDGVDVNL